LGGVPILKPNARTAIPPVGLYALKKKKKTEENEHP